MPKSVLQFPISQAERLRQWDATTVDLGECVHDDCDQPAMFYLTHRIGTQPSLKFATGEHALKMKRFSEQPVGDHLGEVVSHRAPVVCGDCAMGALAALIAYGS